MLSVAGLAQPVRSQASEAASLYCKADFSGVQEGHSKPSISVLSTLPGAAVSTTNQQQ